MDLVMRYTCAAMPAWVFASPAVVMVRTPCRKVISSFGSGVGSQRSCAIGRADSWHGGERHSPASTFLKRPECFTEGRMRYSQERSLVPRGAVKGEPDNCSA